MKKIFVFALVGLWVNAAAIAGGPAKSKAADKTLSVDTKASKVVWVGKKVTGEHTGGVPISSGSLIVDKDKLKGGSFVLDTKSLTVTDLTDNDSNGKLTGHLKGNDFFAVDKYPTSKLDITSVKATGTNAYDVTGKLRSKALQMISLSLQQLRQMENRFRQLQNLPLTVLNMTLNSVQLISLRTLETRQSQMTLFLT